MEIIIAFVAGLICGAVIAWLALRNNPKVEAKLDELAKTIENLKK